MIGVLDMMAIGYGLAPAFMVWIVWMAMKPKYRPRWFDYKIW